ncbi:hypothetical protein CHUAL_012769 [Chamberlinius hualienensis]
MNLTCDTDNEPVKRFQDINSILEVQMYVGKEKESTGDEWGVPFLKQESDLLGDVDDMRNIAESNIDINSTAPVKSVDYIHDDNSYEPIKNSNCIKIELSTTIESSAKPKKSLKKVANVSAHIPNTRSTRNDQYSTSDESVEKKSEEASVESRSLRTTIRLPAQLGRFRKINGSDKIKMAMCITSFLTKNPGAPRRQIINALAYEFKDDFQFDKLKNCVNTIINLYRNHICINYDSAFTKSGEVFSKYPFLRYIPETIIIDKSSLTTKRSIGWSQPEKMITKDKRMEKKHQNPIKNIGITQRSLDRTSSEDEVSDRIYSNGRRSAPSTDKITEEISDEEMCTNYSDVSSLLNKRFCQALAKKLGYNHYDKILRQFNYILNKYRRFHYKYITKKQIPINVLDPELIAKECHFFHELHEAYSYSFYYKTFIWKPGKRRGKGIFCKTKRMSVKRANNEDKNKYVKSDCAVMTTDNSEEFSRITRSSVKQQPAITKCSSPRVVLEKMGLRETEKEETPEKVRVVKSAETNAEQVKGKPKEVETQTVLNNRETEQAELFTLKMDATNIKPEDRINELKILHEHQLEMKKLLDRKEERQFQLEMSKLNHEHEIRKLKLEIELEKLRSLKS